MTTKTSVKLVKEEDLGRREELQSQTKQKPKSTHGTLRRQKQIVHDFWDPEGPQFRPGLWSQTVQEASTGVWTHLELAALSSLTSKMRTVRAPISLDSLKVKCADGEHLAEHQPHSDHCVTQSCSYDPYCEIIRDIACICYRLPGTALTP